MSNRQEALLSDFVLAQHLPASYMDLAKRWFLPLTEEILTTTRRGDLGVLGIVGCQGSGKSTLAALLAELLTQLYQLKVAVLSLDDFYLTREQRQQLGADVHPLLRTRGVPGTHDLQLATQTIEALLNRDDTVAIPRFDKARDDRRPEPLWDNFSAPAHLVILEGWCLAAEPQPEADLVQPINKLEADEDPDGRWRRYVNSQLAETYPQLFQQMDALVAIVAPNFECVYRWRQQQEAQLSADKGDAIMNEVALQRFVQHFERITRYNLSHQSKADVAFYLDENQGIRRRKDKCHA